MLVYETNQAHLADLVWALLNWFVHVQNYEKKGEGASTVRYWNSLVKENLTKCEYSNDFKTKEMMLKLYHAFDLNEYKESANHGSSGNGNRLPNDLYRTIIQSGKFQGKTRGELDVQLRNTPECIEGGDSQPEEVEGYEHMDRSELVTALDELDQNYARLGGDYARLGGDYARLQGDYARLSEENSALRERSRLNDVSGGYSVEELKAMPLNKSIPLRPRDELVEFSLNAVTEIDKLETELEQTRNSLFTADSENEALKLQVCVLKAELRQKEADLRVEGQASQLVSKAGQSSLAAVGASSSSGTIREQSSPAAAGASSSSRTIREQSSPAAAGASSSSGTIREQSSSAAAGASFSSGTIRERFRSCRPVHKGCNCGQQYTVGIVTAETSPNVGRKFWKCSNHAFHGNVTHFGGFTDGKPGNKKK